MNTDDIRIGNDHGGLELAGHIMTHLTQTQPPPGT